MIQSYIYWCKYQEKIQDSIKYGDNLLISFQLIQKGLDPQEAL